MCTSCRTNKLRCDRKQPCGNCVRRDQGAVCYYELVQGSRNDINRNLVAEDRLLHLEAMVKQLIESQTCVQPTANVASAFMTPPEISPGLMTNPEQPKAVQTNHEEYAGSTHWSSILDDIHELKVALTGSLDSVSADNSATMATLVLDSEPIIGSPSSCSLQQIIDQYLPPKVELDRLLALYFRGRTFITPFIHTFHFQHQYREFWNDPGNCNPLWLSLLFSICFVGSLVAGQTCEEHQTENAPAIDSSLLRAGAGKCLVLGHYHRPQEFGPEALAMYAVSVPESDCLRAESLPFKIVRYGIGFSAKMLCGNLRRPRLHLVAPCYMLLNANKV